MHRLREIGDPSKSSLYPSSIARQGYWSRLEVLCLSSNPLSPILYQEVGVVSVMLKETRVGMISEWVLHSSIYQRSKVADGMILLHAGAMIWLTTMGMPEVTRVKARTLYIFTDLRRPASWHYRGFDGRIAFGKKWSPTGQWQDNGQQCSTVTLRFLSDNFHHQTTRTECNLENQKFAGCTTKMHGLVWCSQTKKMR